MYWLAEARAAGADPGNVIDKAQQRNGSLGTPRAPLVKACLLRNLKICDGLGMVTPKNLAKLKRGNAPVVMRGPCAGQLALAKKFQDAGILSDVKLADVQARFKPSGTYQYQLRNSKNRTFLPLSLTLG